MVERRKCPSSHFPNQPEQHPPQFSTFSTLNWFSPCYSFFAVAVHSDKIALSVHIFQNSEHSFSAKFEKNPAEVFSPGITSHISASNLATHLTTSEQAAGSAGAGDGHEQTHESVGRPQDHGGDEEGGWQRGSPSRQLQRQNTGFGEKTASPGYKAAFTLAVSGATEHGPLRGPFQPDQAVGMLQGGNY